MLYVCAVPGGLVCFALRAARFGITIDDTATLNYINKLKHTANIGIYRDY